jgi:hypothetical protein
VPKIFEKDKVIQIVESEVTVSEKKGKKGKEVMTREHLKVEVRQQTLIEDEYSTAT